MNLQIIDQSMSKRRVFAGNQLRALRTRRGLLQTAMARALGISASYLCQLENDERHLTPALADRLRAQFPVDWEDLAPDRQDLLADALRQAVADPLLPAALPSEQIERVAEQFPAFAEQFVRMHAIHRRDRQRLEMLDEALGSDSVAAGSPAAACRGRKCATGSTLPTTTSIWSIATPKSWRGNSRPIGRRPRSTGWKRGSRRAA
jgi:transcriptional regulator with XRE-family HTH domain